MATIGQILTAPEIGWKRISNLDNHFSYNGFAIVSIGTEYSWNNENIHDNAGSTSGSFIKFNFTGSKLRILLFTNFDKSASNIIKIKWY